MEKFKYIFLVVALSLLTFVSCEVLDEKIVSGVTEDTHYATPEGFGDAVNAAYRPLRDFYADEDGCEITVFGTDEYTNGGHGGAHAINQYTAGLNGESGTFTDPWQHFYEGINTCNAAIAHAEGVDLPADEVASMLGEVRFLRAHYYYLLVEFWGPVHLTLDETVGVETEANRTEESDIYGAIIDDLVYAMNYLPEVQAEFGRITKWAAMHHLALVYLTRAYKSWASDPSADFTEATTLADRVINESDRALVEDYQRIYNEPDGKGGLVHTPATEKNSEIIFSVQYDIDPLKNGEGNRNHLYFRPWYEVYDLGGGLDRALGSGYGRPWIRFRPTYWMLNNFHVEDGIDSRYEKSFQIVWYFNTTTNIPEGASVGDTAIWVTHESLSAAKIAEIQQRLPGCHMFSWNNADIDSSWSLWRSDLSIVNPNINIFPCPWKWEDNLRPSLNATEGSRDFPVFRLSETYLIAAEAYVGLNQNATAAARLNVVRERAAYEGHKNDMDVSAAEVDLDFVLDEWSRETFGEQQRWLDLKRTGKLIERVRAYNLDASPNIQEFHVLRPIPVDQLELTTNDYQQNAGY